MFKGLLGKLDNLVIGGKSQSYQLVFSEAIDLRMPLWRCEGLQAQALFKPDDPILNLEGIGSNSYHRDERGNRENQQPRGVDVEVVHEEGNGNDEVDGQNGRQNHVIGRIEARVVLEILRV